MTKFEALCKSMEDKIKGAFQEGVSLEDAEKLAGEFLYAQIQVSSQLKTADLDARMRKTGVKAVRAAIYLDGATKGDKKPSDVMLQALVDADPIVQGEQNDYDKAEASKDELERYYNIFREAHIHFRGIAKGKFE